MSTDLLISHKSDKVSGETDKQRPGADAPDQLSKAAHLGQADLQDIKNIKSLTSTTSHSLPTLLLDEHQHDVKKGETLSGIASKHLGHAASTKEIYNYVNQLAKLNHIDNVDQIKIGQKIIFDAATQPGAAAKPEAPAKPESPTKPEAPAKPQTPSTPETPAKAPTTEKQNELPSLTLMDKAKALGTDIGSGMVDEVVNHPGQVLKSAAIGVGIAVGATLLAPEVAIGLGLVGAAAGIYELAKHGGDWIHAGEVVANPNGHSAKELEESHATLHGIGQGITDLAAGAAGGAIGNLAVKIGGEAIAGELSTLTGAGRTATADAAATDAAATDATTAVAKTDLPVKIKASDEFHRKYEIDGQTFKLERKDGDAWFYGKNSATGEAAPIKVHVFVNGAEDLGRVQKVLIPFLNDNPEAQDLTVAWKTMDPNAALGKPVPLDFTPGPTGQNAKGFVVFAKTSEGAMKLQNLLDRELSENGLGLEKPMATGNVDTIAGSSNRVGTVREHFPITKDANNNVGIVVDDGLSQRIENTFANGGKLNQEQLNALEKECGLMEDTLSYDTEGKLMLMINGSEPKNGLVYVYEQGVGTEFGELTDRPAIYALSRMFGLNPEDALASFW